TGATNATVVGAPIGTGTIINDDSTVSIGNATSINEGNGLPNAVMTFPLTLVGTNPQPITITYNTTGSTATAGDLVTPGSDFVAPSGTLIIPANTAPGIITIAIEVIGDTTPELNEVVQITLTGATNATVVGAPIGTGTILNDDSINLTITDMAFNEGIAGNTAFIFTVSLDYPAGVPVNVDYTTANLTATAGSDYATTSGTLTIPIIPAGNTTGTITVNVTGDTTPEPDEIFAVLLSNVTNVGGTIPVVIADNQGLGTILNDDGAIPTVGFSTLTYSVGEAGPNAVLRVRLSMPAPGAISVPYTLADGTATSVAPNIDYTNTGGTLNFTTGQIEQTILVPITNDLIAEPDEIFSVTLGAPTGATLDLAMTTATVAIIDDDTVSRITQANFMQTAGPNYNPNGWNYYPVPSLGNTYNYLRIDVPCVTGSPAVQIDLFDAGLNTTSARDQINGGADNTTFTLYQMPTGWSYVSSLSLPAPLAPSLSTVTYLPNSVPGTGWTTMTTTSGCGIYLLRAETQTNDVNSWGISVGWAAAAVGSAPSDRDGIAGNGDEISVGMQQISLLYVTGVAYQCTTLYEYVRPGQPQATFNNYDLDDPWMNPIVTYYRPSDSYDPQAITGGLSGTLSANGVWNGTGGTIDTRVGDSYLNPESGWWRIVTCTNTAQNQYIQEGQTSQASYIAQPGTPALDLSLTPSAATVPVGGILTFTANYTNTSSGITAGAAINTTFSVTLPSDLTYVPGSCIGAVSCVLSGSTLTITVPTVVAGATGNVTFSTTASANLGLVGLNLQADYNDVLGNPFVGTTGTVVRIQ
ncbi:MAG: Calx-beta domain-containing protein, partial [Chloroflexales bacterium]